MFERYSIYPSRIGTLQFNQIGGASIMTGNAKNEFTPGGAIDRAAVLTSHADPGFTLNSHDIDGILGTLVSPKVDPLVGYIWDTTAQVPTPSALIQFQHRIDGATFSTFANGVHLAVQINKGWIGIQSISASQDDVQGANISLHGVPLSTDGQLPPLNPLSGQALVGTPTYSSIFYLGPVVSNAADALPANRIGIPGVQSVTYSPGIHFRTVRGDGEPFAMHGGIYRRLPELRITTLDPQAFLTVFGNSTHGKAMTVPLTCYFQRGIHGGTRVSASTVSHFAITAVTGDETPDTLAASGVETDMGIEFTIRPTGLVTWQLPIAIPAFTWAD